MSDANFFPFMPNVKDEPRLWLARFLPSRKSASHRRWLYRLVRRYVWFLRDAQWLAWAFGYKFVALYLLNFFLVCETSFTDKLNISNLHF